MSERFKIIDFKKDFNLLRQHLGINLSQEEKVIWDAQEKEAWENLSDFAKDFASNADHFFQTKILRRNTIDVYGTPRFRLTKDE